MMKQSLNIVSVLLLVSAFLIYSTTGVFTKFASGEIFLSMTYMLYFSMVIVAMGIYAVMWQLILKRVPLSQAYLYKSMTVFFSLFFAFSIFNEEVTWKNMLGAVLIISGIIVNSQSKSLA